MSSVSVIFGVGSLVLGYIMLNFEISKPISQLDGIVHKIPSEPFFQGVFWVLIFYSLFCVIWNYFSNRPSVVVMSHTKKITPEEYELQKNLYTRIKLNELYRSPEFENHSRNQPRNVNVQELED